jgi:hypothetical protein
MWLDIVIVALLIAGGLALAELVGGRNRMLTRRTYRRAEDIYDQHGDSPSKRRRLAGQRGGTSQDQPSSPR